MKKEEKDYLECLMKSDLSPSSPELCVFKPYIHWDNNCEAFSSAAEVCGIITRYYDDEKDYIRAYSVCSDYKGGFAIFYNKIYGYYSTFILGEDDGCWFFEDQGYFTKAEFLTTMSEAFSIFNSNFKEYVYYNI